MENLSLAELMDSIGTRVGHTQMYKEGINKILVKNVRKDAVGVHAENGWKIYEPKAQPVEARKFNQPVVPKINPEPFKVPVPKEYQKPEKVEAKSEETANEVAIETVEKKQPEPVKEIPASGTTGRRGRRQSNRE